MPAARLAQHGGTVNKERRRLLLRGEDRGWSEVASACGEDTRAVDARAVDARAVDARAVDARAVDARAKEACRVTIREMR
jgi:hypothetical protein